MNTVKQNVIQGIWDIALSGKIDSSNAAEIEAELKTEETVNEVIVDMENLEYISSAGLRILLRLKKKYDALEIVNVSSEVYEILDMTGFTEIMTVKKAFRTVSIEGCEEIGRGSNGVVYRTDPDTIVKVYFNKDALPEIEHERAVARKALILGIPTAISYDVVKVGDGYGSVFEMLNARSITKMLRADPDDLETPAKIFVDMLRSIHAIEAEPDTFPSAKETAVHWAEFLQEYLPKDLYDKLMQLIQGIPEDNHLVHGDYHSNNVMVQNGETLLIDMDTLSQGHPILELGSMFLAYRGFQEIQPENCMKFLGITADLAYKFWKVVLRIYLNTTDEAAMQELEDKASVIGYTRMMRRTIRRIGFDDPVGKATIELCERRLTDLCARCDSLID